MEKKAYSKPKIFRVKLNSEQAVLSQCSDTSMDLKNSDPQFCDARCRQANRGNKADFEGSS